VSTEQDHFDDIDRGTDLQNAVPAWSSAHDDGDFWGGQNGPNDFNQAEFEMDMA
jgi:hypothetical protein